MQLKMTISFKDKWRHSKCKLLWQIYLEANLQLFINNNTFVVLHVTPKKNTQNSIMNMAENCIINGILSPRSILIRTFWPCAPKENILSSSKDSFQDRFFFLEKSDFVLLSPFKGKLGHLNIIGIATWFYFTSILRMVRSDIRCS